MRVDLRRGAHVSLQRLASAKTALGLQPPIVDSVQAWANQRGIESTTLFPPRSFVRKLPRTIEPEVHQEFTSRQVVQQRGRYLVPLHGARLLGQRGLVLLPGGGYAAESAYLPSLVKADPAYYVPRRRPIIAKSGDFFSLVVNWVVESGGNYYHWVHDTLSRLFGVLPLLPENTTFILPPNLEPFAHETLRLLGVDQDRVTYFTGEEIWELETLHFAPPTTNSGSHRREADEWVRDRMLAGLGVTLRAPRRRIYVSRREVHQRRVVNDTDVEVSLRRHGFETHLPEKLTLREQAELFAEADIVVSTHGSAFTNMLFAPPGLTVVDMIPPQMIPWAFVFWAMAEELGHHYWYFLADSVPRPGHQDDTHVPLDKLAATLDRLQPHPVGGPLRRAEGCPP